MSRVTIYNQNVLDFFNIYDGPKFNLALYDPPYEMNIINNKWDRSGVVFSKEYNEGLYHVLKPGAFVLCYGHARTFHRVMVALEDTGFIVHKAIFGWGYSSGYPQGAVNLQRNLDKYYANQYGGICTCETPSYSPESDDNIGYINPDFNDIGLPVRFCINCKKIIRTVISTIKWHSNTGKKNLGGPGYGNNNEQLITEPLTIDAKLLSPYTYGLASFKPMVEPIILVQKPWENDNAVQTIIDYGTGIVNVHETRYIDRWPGNFIAIHEIGCELQEDGKWKCVDGCEIGEQIKQDADFTEKYPTFAYNEVDLSLSSIDPMVIESKPNKKEKIINGKQNPHVTIKPVKLNQYLAKLFLPPSEFENTRAFVPFSGSGSEIMGLLYAGWQDITGVELSKEYADFSVERVQHLSKAKVYYVSG